MNPDLTTPRNSIGEGKDVESVALWTGKVYPSLNKLFGPTRACKHDAVWISFIHVTTFVPAANPSHMRGTNVVPRYNVIYNALNIPKLTR